MSAQQAFRLHRCSLAVPTQDELSTRALATEFVARFSQWYGSIPTSWRASLQELGAAGPTDGPRDCSGVRGHHRRHYCSQCTRRSVSHLFAQITSRDMGGPYLALVLTPALTVLIVWWTRRFVPGALGSGIPQVVRALGEDTQPHQVKWLVSLRVSAQKIVLVSGGLLAGLSIGREGPMVQIGAGVMSHARRWLSKASVIDAHDLMVAGAAAGIAVAFNTPLGGVIFAIEQLSRRRSMTHSSIVIACIVLAGLVSVSVFGNLTYFGRLRVQYLSWSLLGPGLPVAVVAGLAGGLFARLIVASVRGLPDRYSRWRTACPLRFAAGCALLVAIIGIVSDGATAGAGYGPTRAMLEGTAELPGVFTVLKFCAT